MNFVGLLGRLTSDVELKTTSNGVSVASFSVAVDRAYKTKDEERQTDFINCVAWRGTAEFISKYFHKGQRIALQGSLQSRKYTANDGSQRTVHEVVCDNAFFCESKAAPNVNVNAEPSAEFKTAVQNDFEEIITDEDLPF